MELDLDALIGLTQVSKQIAGLRDGDLPLRPSPRGLRAFPRWVVPTPAPTVVDADEINHESTRSVEVIMIGSRAVFDCES